MVLAAACSAPPAENLRVELSIDGTQSVPADVDKFHTLVAQGCPGHDLGRSCVDHVTTLVVEFCNVYTAMLPYRQDSVLKEGVGLADRGSRYIGRDYADPSVQRDVLTLADQLDAWLKTHHIHN